jgi:hypothetical protein
MWHSARAIANLVGIIVQLDQIFAVHQLASQGQPHLLDKAQLLGAVVIEVRIFGPGAELGFEGFLEFFRPDIIELLVVERQRPIVGMR